MGGKTRIWGLCRWNNFRTLCDYNKRVGLGEWQEGAGLRQERRGHNRKGAGPQKEMEQQWEMAEPGRKGGGAVIEGGGATAGRGVGL